MAIWHPAFGREDSAVKLIEEMARVTRHNEEMATR